MRPERHIERAKAYCEDYKARATRKPHSPSLPYEEWLIDSLKDRKEAAAYLEAEIEDSDQAALVLALRHVAQAQGGVAEIARRANLTREARRAARFAIAPAPGRDMFSCRVSVRAARHNRDTAPLLPCKSYSIN